MKGISIHRGKPMGLVLPDTGSAGEEVLGAAGMRVLWGGPLVRL